jgi:flagellin
MSLSITTNTGALMAAAAATSVNQDMETSMERLSTGKRINSASDDAAGVAIASRLTAEIKGNNQAIRNAQDAQGMINTAEGAHKEVENILQRMRELSVQSANDTNSADDRTNLQAEVDQLMEEVDRIAGATTWAGQQLLNGNADSGSGTKSFDFQVGNGVSSSNTIDADMIALTTSQLALVAGGTTVDISGITETAGASLGPVVVDAITTTGTTGITQNAGAANEVVMTVGTWAATQTISFDVNGTNFSASTNASPGYAGDANGTAAKFAQAINDQGLAGITATASTNTFTITKVATTSLTESGSNQLTVATFDALETLSVDLDGTTVSVTNGVASGYTQDVNGTAAMLGDAINAAMTGTTAAVNNGQIDLTKSATTFGIGTAADAKLAITAIDNAINTVNTQRAGLGAVSNRLDSTVSNLTNVVINLEGGRGRIEDADFAGESTSLAKAQILQQASTAMLAQANASKQNVLSLLQG